MPSHYSADQKAAVLAQLEANGWNVTLTAHETGVPERTLHSWRRHLWQQQQRQSPPPSPPLLLNPDANPFSSPPLYAAERGPGGEVLNGPEDASAPPLYAVERGLGGEDHSPESDIAALSNLRRHLLDELVAMSADLERGLKLTSPYQKVLILTQLLDRLMKLDEHLKPYTVQDNVVRIEYTYPDGTIHDVPPWMEPHPEEERAYAERTAKLDKHFGFSRSGLLDTGDPDW